jgi:hypothetical protein
MDFSKIPQTLPEITSMLMFDDFHYAYLVFQASFKEKK